MAKSKVNLSASQISEKWGRNMKNAVTTIQNGIDAVTESPMEKAAAQQPKLVQNWNNAVNSGRWANATRAVQVGDWKRVTKLKVASSLGAGVDNAMPKRQKFDNYLVNTLNSILPELNSMPKMTIEDSVNKVRRLMEHMSTNRYKGGANG